jgi:drug/metabolite transporter (DMT)-like permease
MLAGYTVFSFVPVLVWLAHSAGAGAAVAVMVRFAVGLLCVAAMLTIAGQKLQTRNFRILALRGLFGGAAVMFFFIGVAGTGAGMGTLLNYTHSIWGNVLAVLVLRHKPARGFWLLLLAAVIGLYLVVNPEVSIQRPAAFWGALAGLLSGLLGGAAILCIKTLRKTDGPLTIFFSFTVVGFVVAWLCLAPHLLRSDFGPLEAGFAWPALRALIAMGVLSFGGQMLFTAGYKNTSIQVGTLLSLTTPVLAVLNGHLFFGEPLSVRFVVGAAMIMGACMGVSVLEKRREEPARPHTTGL